MDDMSKKTLNDGGRKSFSIACTQETHARITKLANANKRTLYQQLEALCDLHDDVARFNQSLFEIMGIGRSRGLSVGESYPNVFADTGSTDVVTGDTPPETETLP